MAKILKAEKANYSETGEMLPAFLITVDTETSSDEDISVVMKEIADELNFTYIPEGISAYDAIKAANSYKDQGDIPTASTWDRVTDSENVCLAAEFVFNNIDKGFIVAGIKSVFSSSLGRWLITFWGVNTQYAKEWHF